MMLSSPGYIYWTFMYEAFGIPTENDCDSDLIDKNVVIPRATRAGAFDTFIQNPDQDMITHIIEGKNA